MNQRDSDDYKFDSLMRDFFRYDDHCNDIFLQYQHRSTITKIRKLQEYIQNIIEFVTYIIYSDPLFEQLPCNMKIDLLESFKNGQFRNHCTSIDHLGANYNRREIISH